jgi:molecular chaperone HscB
MIDFSRNHFELFGLGPAYRIDIDALDRAYRSLQSEVHPDQFASASDADRRRAMQASTRVNEAYRTLKDPVERARYLISLRGADPLDERDTTLPLDFLEAQLERRERAALAADAGDMDVLDRILAEVRDDFAARQQQVADLLDVTGDVQRARTTVRELRFLSKVADDVDAMLAELEE